MTERDLPSATIRASAEDFVVEELPAYEACGDGEHVFVTFRKVELTTPDAVHRLAEALGADPARTGHAGMKDRHAVTTQTASFWLPHGEPPLVGGQVVQGLEVLAVARHRHKLKPGHLRGNRFCITLRDLAPGAIDAVVAGLNAAGRQGVPNRFGGQRFGRQGDNAGVVAGWLAGRTRPPRDRHRKRLLFSAWQSALFNEVLERRVADSTWARILPGDLAQRASGGMFLVPAGGPDLDDAVARGQAGELSATGPIFGATMRWPDGAPAALEREVLAGAVSDPAVLQPFKALGAGSRRPLRLSVEGLRWEPGPVDSSLRVRFALPKGGYATTLLGTVCHLREPKRGDAVGGLR